MEGYWTRPGDQESGSAAITAKAGVMDGIIVTTDGTNAVTLDIYDNATAASGTKLIPTLTITTSASNRTFALTFTRPVHYVNGIYVNETCSGTVAYMVYFKND